MASVDATAHAPLAPPSVCTSPSRQQMDGSNLQRPFTASGARRTRLLSVQVHWGEHLDRLSHRSIDDTAEADAPSTYIALRASRNTTQTGSSGSNTKSHPPPTLQDVDAVEGEWYELRSLPFATSRVVERSAHPTWNELLLVPLPIGWRQQAGAATWMLHVDVVGRDPSQQEDSLLATVELPLASLASDDRPQNLRVELQPRHEQGKTPSETVPRPCVYLSLSEIDNLETPREVAEVTVHELDHAAQLVAKMEATSSQALLLVSTLSLPASTQLRDVFHDPHENSHQDPANRVWISPMSRPRAVEQGERRLQWQFPMVFHLPHASDQENGAFDSLGVHLFTLLPFHASDSDILPVISHGASSTVTLLHVPLNGTSTALKATLEVAEAESSARQLHLSLTARRWDPDAWTRFQNTSVNRRVITTNRRHRKRAELQALEWTGALCRGLNRYPISSFCDEGGLSGLLASYLAANNTAAMNAVGQAPRTDSNATADGGADDARLPLELLNQHIRLLQQELMAKQETIHQIQREMEAQKSTVQRCGVELVATRRDVRARDELLAQLQAKIRETDERDAGQTRELLAATGGLTGLRLDSQGAQRMNVLIFKYKELEQRHQTTLTDLADAKRAAGVFEQLERKYADLEQAHIVQAALVQRLQKDKTQNADLQKTIRMQEKVIRKFEKAVQHERQRQSPPRPTVAAPDIPNGAIATGEETPMQAMRTQVLERQLQVNAKAAASEIGRLKMRIMELETQLSHHGEEHPHHQLRG